MHLSALNKDFRKSSNWRSGQCPFLATLLSPFHRTIIMKRSRSTLFATSFLLAASIPVAAAEDSAGFEKKNFNYSEWAKGRFSEVVSVKNPGRLLFLGGIGAEDEDSTTGGAIKYLGDAGAQCRYAWDKIKGLMEKQGSSLSDG